MALTQEDRARIIEMFDAGTHRNDIARALRVSGSTVSSVCRQAGRTFDRANEILALRAEEADLEKLRQSVTTKMLLVADDTLDNLSSPHLVYNFGGKDNTYEEHLLDEAPLDMRLDAMRAASLAVDKATRIVEKDRGGLDEAVGMLDALAAGFSEAAEKYRAEDEALIGGDDER